MSGGLYCQFHKNIHSNQFYRFIETQLEAIGTQAVDKCFQRFFQASCLKLLEACLMLDGTTKSISTGEEEDRKSTEVTKH